MATVADNQKTIEAFFDLIRVNEVWQSLSSSSELDWNEELIDKYISKWDWQKLSENSSINWTTSMLIKYEDFIHWQILSWVIFSDKNSFDVEMFEKFQLKWHWSAISQSKILPWSEEFIDKYIDKWDWSILSGNNGCSLYGIHQPDYQLKFEWTIPMIEKYQERIDWSVLTFHLFCNHQEREVFDIELFEWFESKWDWDVLSEHSFLLSEEIIDKYLDKWDWKLIINNELILGDWDCCQFYSKYKSQILAIKPSDCYDSFPSSELWRRLCAIEEVRLLNEIKVIAN